MQYDENSILGLFGLDGVKEIRTVDTCHGDDDFREAVFVTTADGRRLVIKVAGNAFTTPESVGMWQRCADEYRKLGYYTPGIFAAEGGSFRSLITRGTGASPTRRNIQSTNPRQM